jgi:hypothetical protein
MISIVSLESASLLSNDDARYVSVHCDDDGLIAASDATRAECVLHMRLQPVFSFARFLVSLRVTLHLKPDEFRDTFAVWYADATEIDARHALETESHFQRMLRTHAAAVTPRVYLTRRPVPRADVPFIDASLITAPTTPTPTPTPTTGHASRTHESFQQLTRKRLFGVADIDVASVALSAQLFGVERATRLTATERHAHPKACRVSRAWLRQNVTTTTRPSLAYFFERSSAMRTNLMRLNASGDVSASATSLPHAADAALWHRLSRLQTSHQCGTFAQHVVLMAVSNSALLSVPCTFVVTPRRFGVSGVLLRARQCMASSTSFVVYTSDAAQRAHLIACDRITHRIAGTADVDDVADGSNIRVWSMEELVRITSDSTNSPDAPPHVTLWFDNAHAFTMQQWAAIFIARTLPNTHLLVTGMVDTRVCGVSLFDLGDDAHVYGIGERGMTLVNEKRTGETCVSLVHDLRFRVDASSSSTTTTTTTDKSSVYDDDDDDRASTCVYVHTEMRVRSREPTQRDIDDDDAADYDTSKPEETLVYALTQANRALKYEGAEKRDDLHAVDEYGGDAQQLHTLFVHELRVE